MCTIGPINYGPPYISKRVAAYLVTYQYTLLIPKYQA